LNKTLTINIYQDPTKHVEAFLLSWQKFGTYKQCSDLSYTLVGKNSLTSILSITQDTITIVGQIPSKTFMIIDTLAKACKADKVIEGEVIDKKQTRHQTNNQTFNGAFASSAGAAFQVPFGMGRFAKITALSKTKLILLLIIALPILIIMIPIIIVVAIIKIIMFKLKFK